MDKLNWSKILNIRTVFDTTKNHEVIGCRTNMYQNLMIDGPDVDSIINRESFSHFFNLVLPDYRVIDFNMSPFSEHMEFKSETFETRERNRENITFVYNEKIKYITLDDLEETVFKQPFTNKELNLPHNLLIRYIVRWLKFDTNMDGCTKELMLEAMRLKLENIMSKEV